MIISPSGVSHGLLMMIDILKEEKNLEFTVFEPDVNRHPSECSKLRDFLGHWIDRRKFFQKFGLWHSSSDPVFKGLDTGSSRRKSFLSHELP
jgi:hypothetical protein